MSFGGVVGMMEGVGAGLVRSDLLDAQRLAKLLASGFVDVSHFAVLSLIGESVEQPGRYYRRSGVGTLNLLEGMRLAGVAPLVSSSTTAIYLEPEEVSITETAPTCQTGPYGGSKLAVEGMIGFHAWRCMQAHPCGHESGVVRY